MVKCIECQQPARTVRGTDDQYTDHCSDACALVTWKRYTDVGSFTVAEIDEKLATTGFSVEGLC